MRDSTSFGTTPPWEKSTPNYEDVLLPELRDSSEDLAKRHFQKVAASPMAVLDRPLSE